MLRLQLVQARLLSAFRHLPGTSRGKPAPRRQVHEIGGKSFDRLQPIAAQAIQARHDTQQTDRIGMPGQFEQHSDRCLLDGLAGIHDHDAIGIAGDDAEVMGDEDQGDIEPLRQILHQFQNLRLHGHVERRRRFVGDQELRIAADGHGDHDALAHAAGELMRVLLEPVRRIGNSHQLEQLLRACPGRRLRHAEMRDQRLHDLEPDRQHRIQARHGFLKNHADIPAAALPHGVIGELQQVDAIEQNLAADDAAGLLGKQSEYGQDGDGFAAAALSHQCHDLAAPDRKACPVDRADAALPRGKLHAQLLDVQEMAVCAGRFHEEIATGGRHVARANGGWTNGDGPAS